MNEPMNKSFNFQLIIYSHSFNPPSLKWNEFCVKPLDLLVTHLVLLNKVSLLAAHCNPLIIIIFF